MSQPEINMQKTCEKYGLKDEHHGKMLVSKTVSHLYLYHDLSVVSFTIQRVTPEVSHSNTHQYNPCIVYLRI